MRHKFYEWGVMTAEEKALDEAEFSMFLNNIGKIKMEPHLDLRPQWLTKRDKCLGAKKDFSRGGQ